MKTGLSVCVIVALVFLLTLANGQQEQDKGKNVSCSVWYHNMPESIVCQEDTHFSAACQIYAPCGVEVDAVWYWSPENETNSSYLITDSPNARTRSLSLPTASCDNNSASHFYTLTLAKLSRKNAGYYWCQLKILNEGSSVKNLLPSNKCYVGINNTVSSCEYGEHKGGLRCAQSQESLIDNEDSDEITYSQKTNLEVTVESPTSTSLPRNPTLTPAQLTENKQARPQIRMHFTEMEVVLLALVLLCIAIITVLLVCLLWQCRRRRSVSREQTEDNVDKESLDSCHARYTPVSTLTRTHSLASDWCKPSKSKSNLSTAEDPIYSSPYQSLSEVSMDYASMYSKLHQQSSGNDVTANAAAKSATPKDSSF